MAMTTLKDLFEHMLRDIYHAEKQILKTLPKMAEKADSSALRQAFEDHQDETEDQIDRLEQVFSALGLKARGVTCEAIDGTLAEGREIMSETKDADARDAGMIAAAQAVEHYEITRYGTLIAWAAQLGLEDAAAPLGQTLEEEYAADRKLTKLAEGVLNRQAA